MDDRSPFARPLFAPGGSINVVSFLLAAPGATLAQVERTAEVVAGRVPAGVGVFVRRADGREHAVWFHQLLASAPEPEASSLADALAWIELAGDIVDAPDHRSLGAVWDAVREGVAVAPYTLVYDGMAWAWRTGAEVRSHGPTDLRLVAAWRCETIEGFRDGAQNAYVCVHTLGLPKFGRRDVLAFGSEANRSVLEALVAGIATDLFNGAVLSSGDRVAKGGLTVDIELYSPGRNAPELDVPFFAEPLVLLPSA